MSIRTIGVVFVLASGVLYTIERAVAQFVWVAQVASVNINGSGQCPTDPYIPSLHDNPFVWAFLVVGIILSVVELITPWGRRFFARPSA